MQNKRTAVFEAKNLTGSDILDIECFIGNRTFTVQPPLLITDDQTFLDIQRLLGSKLMVELTQNTSSCKTYELQLNGNTLAVFEV